MASLSRKMKTLVLCDGYEMRHDKSNTLKTIRYWRCLKRFFSGRAKSEFDGTRNLETTKAHNCRKSFSKIELREQMKMDAISSYTKLTIDVISSGNNLIKKSDYHLFRSLQHFLRGKQYATVQEISEDIDCFFSSKPAGFYVKGISRLQERWEKVVEFEGDYFVD